MNKLTIDRSKWAVPTNLDKTREKSSLQTASGLKCCLGFVAETCGLKNFENKLDFASLGRTSHRKLPKILLPVLYSGSISHSNGNLDSVSPDCLHEQLVTVNDFRGYSHRERETKIKKLLKEAGISVTFKGKYL